MTETPSDNEEELPPALEALLACSEEREREALDKILTDGHDQGWVLSDCADDVLTVTPAQAETLHRRADQRARTEPSVSDPWSEQPPSALPIPDAAEHWAILTQRCDLVRSIAVEPLIEIARVVKLESGAAAAAKTNSPRLVFLTDAADGSVWAADLRQRAFMSKLSVLSMTATPAVAGARAQKRFRLRLGQRYWRDPVPDDLVESLQRPLINAVRTSRTRIARFENFSMWLGLRGESGVVVIAVAQEDRKAGAEEDWGAVVNLLSEKAPQAVELLDLDESGVFTADDVPLSLWLDTFKFDFDELTYARRAADSSAEPPA